MMLDKYTWSVLLSLALFGIIGCGEAPSKKANKSSESSISKEQRQKLLKEQTKWIFREFVEKNKPISVDWDKSLTKGSSNEIFHGYARFFTFTLQKALAKNSDSQVLLSVSLKDVYEKNGKYYGLFVSSDDSFRIFKNHLLFFELEVPDEQLEALIRMTPPGRFTFESIRFLVAAKIDSVDKIWFKIQPNELDVSNRQKGEDIRIEMAVGNNFWITGVATDLVHVPNDLQEEALKETTPKK